MNDGLPKYLLARAVIIRHIQTNAPVDFSGIEFHHFQSLDDNRFRQFLYASDAYFVMIHDGAVSGYFQSKAPTFLELKRELDRTLNSYQKPEEHGGTDLDVPTRTIISKYWLRVMISWFLSNKYNVALINEMQFLDSKVRYFEIMILLLLNLFRY